MHYLSNVFSFIWVKNLFPPLFISLVYMILWQIMKRHIYTKLQPHWHHITNTALCNSAPGVKVKVIPWYRPFTHWWFYVGQKNNICLSFAQHKNMETKHCSLELSWYLTPQKKSWRKEKIFFSKKYSYSLVQELMCFAAQKGCFRQDDSQIWKGTCLILCTKQLNWQQ